MINLKSYFYYTRSERIASYILFMVTLAIFFTPKIYSFFYSNPSYDLQAYQAQILAFEAALILEDSIQKTKYNWANTPKKTYEKREKPYSLSQKNKKTTPIITNIQYIDFDPNTAEETTLMQLGLEAKTVKSIINFRNKGGKFRIKSDFKKIYTLKESDYERLLPYLILPDTIIKENKLPPWANENKEKALEKTVLNININTASAEELQQLKGIGSGWSNRIIKYRTALGGFKNIEQLAEIYNFPDSTYQKILPFIHCDSSEINCLSLNEASLEMLSAHPYLSNYQAKAILKWRTELGGFKRTDFIFTIPELDDKKRTAEKIFPYLCL